MNILFLSFSRRWQLWLLISHCFLLAIFSILNTKYGYATEWSHLSSVDPLSGLAMKITSIAQAIISVWLVLTIVIKSSSPYGSGTDGNVYIKLEKQDKLVVILLVLNQIISSWLDLSYNETKNAVSLSLVQTIVHSAFIMGSFISIFGVAVYFFGLGDFSLKIYLQIALLLYALAGLGFIIVTLLSNPTLDDLSNITYLSIPTLYSVMCILVTLTDNCRIMKNNSL